MNALELMGQERKKIFIYLIVAVILILISTPFIQHPVLGDILVNALMVFAIPIIVGHFIPLIYEKEASKNYFFWIRKLFFSYLFVYLLTFLFYIILFRFLQTSGVLGTFDKHQLNSRVLFYFYGAILNSIRLIILFFLIDYKLIYGKNIFSSIPAAFRDLYYFNFSSALLKLGLILAALLFINALLNEAGGIGLFIKAIYLPLIFAYGFIEMISILKNAGVEHRLEIK